MDGALRQEITNLIKRVLETFTLQYTKSYVLALVRLIKLESQEKPSEFLLEERPPWTEDFKTGYLVKEGAVRKNWKKRWFVARPNYTVDYYESEAELQKPKPKKKGTMSLCGYSVVEDPNQGILVRIKRLAEKMGVDFSNLPKPKEYPPLVFELYHSRRRCYYIQAKDKQEFDDWVAAFRTICWRAWYYGLSWDDWCHKRAFPEAVRKTRWELGRWGWYSGYGSEEQILAEMIADELEYDIMGRIYGKLSGPWMVRNMLRNQVQKVIDNMVLTAVKPAWAGMQKVVKELRPKIEPKIREAVGPLFKAEVDIIEKMKNAVMSVIDPLLQEHVCPHLGKIVAILKSPMTDAFDAAFGIWNEHINKWEPQEDLQSSFRNLDYFPRSYWEMRPATEKTDVMYEPLWALHEIFSDIYPWSLIWSAHDVLRNTTDNAVWTWEQALLKAKEEGKSPDKSVAGTVRDQVFEKFTHDADISTTQYFCEILKKIVMPPFEALLQPAAKNIIDPLAELVPEPLQEFLDIKQMFEDLYNGIVDAAIETVVRSDQIAPPKQKSVPKQIAEAESSSSSSSSSSDDEEAPRSPAYITSLHNDLVLDVKGGSIYAGAEVILWNKKPWGEAANQQWILTEDHYIACAANPDLVLDIEGGGGPGTKLILWNRKPHDEASNQRWKWNKHKMLVSFRDKKHVLDVNGGSHDPGTSLIVWEKKDADNKNQQWKVEVGA